jgi:rsbT co-antagonist protein RsbR
MQRAIDVLRSFVPACVDRAEAILVNSSMAFYREIQRDVLRQGIRRILDAIVADIDRGATEDYPAMLARIGAERVAQGADALDLLRAMNTVHDTISAHFREIFADDIEAQLWWERQRSALNHDGVIAFVGAYTTAREALIREQGLQIQRLSAPLVPIYEGILLLPLVGPIDDARAAQITASILESIAARRARIVLVDATGVPFVDRNVAGYLLRAGRASRLMGAEILLVGINPQIAMTMVELGITLPRSVLLGDLESGIQHALRLRGMVIKPAR